MTENKFTNINYKSEFIDYMYNIGLKESPSYEGYVKNRLYQEFEDKIFEITNKKVFEISTLEHLDELYNELKHSAEWDRYSYKSNGHGIPNAILNKHYRKFISNLVDINHTASKNNTSYTLSNDLRYYISTLKNSNNIIFHGAPGTGKTYLAYQIATNFVSNGDKSAYDDLTEDEKQQIQFVQFHPSYDYTDFVEGLRPITIDNSMGFELQDGIFKAFVDKARKNYENSHKTPETLREEKRKADTINKFLEDSISNNIQFETTRKINLQLLIMMKIMFICLYRQIQHKIKK